ncbi:phosphotransferase enzyme family protein [Plebeiibacterium marinum]|uniref:Aminoglycoside phosphotransferase family protein n=1 Tax=Plebeiibacterium marinum TaxID=2992111 RepID=A0AAE3MF04_9BACT|nr:aminoglycoside phosphotransferase family protein [Plebeiobacterium marinum]MCW3806385.1 aminoglycoside phosphotransferase family protein [Plebeiobacterium marinum]
METNIYKIADCFQLEGRVANISPLGEGFINDTFIIETEAEDMPNYLMQRKNKNIFTDVPAMMDNIERVTLHLKEKIKAQGGDIVREALTVVKTKNGSLYHVDDEGEYWAVCLFIAGSITYEAADTPELAYAGGKGIGKFQCMTSDFKGKLADILPGFHNIRYRFKQWDDVLSKDPVGRSKELASEISWIEDRRDEMLKFWEKVENGIIPTRVTHNDTKINNILFDDKGDVLCVIDLDTVLSSTVLNDFGDAIRSYTNTGLEDDKDLDKVSMDLDIFTAYTKGYISETKTFLTQSEIDNLAFSAKYITYEQVLRFLMDYIDGDNYYKTKYPDHNLVRTHAQYKLLQSIENQYEDMKEVVKSSL